MSPKAYRSLLRALRLFVRYDALALAAYNRSPKLPGFETPEARMLRSRELQERAQSALEGTPFHGSAGPGTWPYCYRSYYPWYRGLRLSNGRHSLRISMAELHTSKDPCGGMPDQGGFKSCRLSDFLKLINCRPTEPMNLPESTTVLLGRYKSHKIVRGAKIVAVEHEHLQVEGYAPEAYINYVRVHVGLEWLQRNKPVVGGYLVVYQDGYASYSPAKAFEEGYDKCAEPSFLNTLAGMPDNKLVKVRVYQLGLGGRPFLALKEGQRYLMHHSDFMWLVQKDPSASVVVIATQQPALKGFFGILDSVPTDLENVTFIPTFGGTLESKEAPIDVADLEAKSVDGSIVTGVERLRTAFGHSQVLPSFAEPALEGAPEPKYLGNLMKDISSAVGQPQGHLYALDNLHHDGDQFLQFICKEPKADGAPGELVTKAIGTTNEAVMQALIDRLEKLSAKFPCEENAKTIAHLKAALGWQNLRTERRKARNVEGKALA